MHLTHDAAGEQSVQEIAFTGSLRVDTEAGPIVAVEAYPDARVPTRKLRIDFGAGVGERRSVAQVARGYAPETLFGRQVAEVVKSLRQVGKAMSQAPAPGCAAEEGRVLPFSLNKPVPDGSRLFW